MTLIATGKNPCRRFAKGLLLWTVAHHSPSTCESLVFRNSIARYHKHSPWGSRRRPPGTCAQSIVPTTGTIVPGLSSHPSDQFSVSTNHDSSGILSSGTIADNNNATTTTSSNNNNLSPLALAIQNSIDTVFRLQGNNNGNDDDDGTLVAGDKNTKKKVVVMTISVSGGCDSVAMLHACMECSWSLGLEATIPTLVQVVHFNHQQRGIESDDDATFVQDLCRTYNIPCHVELWSKELVDLDSDHDDNYDHDDKDTLASSKAPTFSQDAAREWRRQRLVKWTQQAMDTLSSSGDYDGSVGIILTAHHKDDSMESLLLKALRGVHLLNLSGMSCLTPLPSTSSASSSSSIFLMRPWIHHVSKQDLIDYLQQKKWSWREDKSNLSSKYLRNRVRNELIPLLQDMTDQSFLQSRIPTWIQQSQEMVQDLQPRIQALSNQVVIRGRDGNHDEDHPYLEWEKSCRLVESTDDLAITPLVQSQTLYQWMTQHSACPVSHDTFQRVLNQLRNHPQKQEWILELGKGWKIQRQGGILRIKQPITTPTTMSDSSTSHNMKEPIGWSWSILSPEELDRIQRESFETFRNHQLPMRWLNQEEIILWISKDWMIPPTVTFYQTTVVEYEQEYQTSVLPQSNNSKTSLMFCPPWKSASTPIKLRQFLRGQGIPLHQRDHVPLLIANHCIVAVQIQKREDLHSSNEWIVNREYYHYSGEMPSSTPTEEQPDCNPNDTTTKVPIRLSTLHTQRRN